MLYPPLIFSFFPNFTIYVKCMVVSLFDIYSNIREKIVLYMSSELKTIPLTYTVQLGKNTKKLTEDIAV